MPIFEFKCRDCKRVHENLFPSVEAADAQMMLCKCGSVIPPRRIPSLPRLAQWSYDPKTEFDGDKEFIAAGGSE